VTLAACDDTKQAKGFLEENGYTEIVFTSSSGHKLGFTAKNAAGQRCTGDIDTTDESTHSAVCNWECTKTNWKGCHARGELLEPTAPAKAIDDYATGCEAGDGACCARLGVMYEQGIGIAKDAAKSFMYDKKACDAGDASRCASLAIDYDQGLGTAKDAALAFRAADMACTHQVMMGCKMSGSALIRGNGTPRDAIKGADRLDKACKSGDSYNACGLLGAALVEGRFLTKDLEHGEHLLDFACNKKDGDACFALGRFLKDKTVTDPNGITASDSFRRGCDLGDAPSCQASSR
jgi:TPR repeat protein